MMTITFTNRGKELSCMLASHDALVFLAKASEILGRYTSRRGYQRTDRYLCHVIKADSMVQIKDFEHSYPQHIQKCVIKGKEYLYYICRGKTVDTKSGKEGKVYLAFFKV